MKTLRLALRTGWRGLALRKGRAALMMLGVAIGIVTLTLVVSTGRGTRARVEKGIASFGPDALVVFAGSPQTHGPGDERVTTLVDSDVEAVRGVGRVRVVAPMVVRVEQPVAAGGRNTTTTVVGSTPDYVEAWDWPVVEGDGIDEAQESGAARVGMIGATAAAALFPDQSPVGRSMRIGDQQFRIIGVLAKRGTSPMGMDMDNRVVVPLSTAMRRLYNTTSYGMVRIRLSDASAADEVAGEVAALLRERHRIGRGETDDFGIRSASAFRQTAATMTGTLTTMLGLVTVISLLAGAFVLANILQAAVSERRVEIGLLRALGATRRQVAQQFVVEGMVVTLLGGAAGVVVGTLAALVLSRTPMPVKATWEPFAFALAASLVVGLAASLVPARRAARIDPATALRPQ